VLLRDPHDLTVNDRLADSPRHAGRSIVDRVDGHRADIDGLRAIAILSVVGYHAFPGLIPGGFAGVDVFFVISGYLISGIIIGALATRSFRFTDFYARRIRRIFPALIIVLVATLICGWFILDQDEFRQLWRQVAGSAAFVANLVQWHDAGYFDAVSQAKPLLHLWSLGIEEQFYIFWPLILYLCWRLRIPFLALIIAVGVPSLVSSWWLAVADPAAAFYSPWPRFWELLAGASLAAMHQPEEPACEPSWRADLMSGTGLALLAIAMVVLDRHQPYPGWRAMIPVAGTALAIHGGPGSQLSRRLLAQRWMVGIGLISYPLYLWHWPLFSMAYIAAGSVPGVMVRAAIVVASVILAWLTFVLVERPVRQAVRSKTMPALLGCALASLGAAGFLGYRSYLDIVPSGNIIAPTDIDVTVDALRNPNDLPEATRCLPALSYLGAAVDRCASNSSDPLVLVLGDSHAGHLYTGLIESQLPVELIWNGGCPPMRELPLADGCDRRWAALERFSQDRRLSLKVVVISTYYNLYVHGESLSGNRNVQHDAAVADIASRHDRQIGVQQVFESGLDRSIGYFERLGLHVVFVLDVPELPYHARSCLVRKHLRQMQEGNGCPATPRAVVDRSELEMRQSTARLLLRHPDLTVFDPATVLCTRQVCHATQDRHLLYRDDNHLSAEGSRVVAAPLVRLLLARLQP